MKQTNDATRRHFEKYPRTDGTQNYPKKSRDVLEWTAFAAAAVDASAEVLAEFLAYCVDCVTWARSLWKSAADWEEHCADW